MVEDVNWAGEASVLVVDDDPSIRLLFTRMLSRMGYRVAGAGSGAEADTLAGEQRFDVLVTDLVLPDASGVDVALRMRARWPRLGVIVISGYGVDIAAGAEAVAEFRFLQKPVDMATIAREVEAVLGGSAG